MAASFPRQDIPEIQKDKKWCSEHLDYAYEIFKNSSARRERFTKLYNSYNGTTDPASVKYMTHAYGKRNKNKYISYRVGRPKIDLINNEFLMRPLQASVMTVNQTAKSAKLENYELMLGAMNAKPDIEKLKEFGVDALEGMNIPDKDDQSVWKQLSAKDKNEALMQTILNHQIPELMMKEKLTKNFQDLEIVAMCYGKIHVDHNGNEEYIRIDPRRAIYEEIEGDTLLRRSPIMGQCSPMTVHEILMSFDLTKEERDEIDKLRTNASQLLIDYPQHYSMINNEFCVNVIHIEWLSVEPEYYKISPKTKSQLEFDNTTDSYKKELSVEEYEKNKEKHDKAEAAGKYRIETKFKKQIWEATRIGHDIDINCRRKQFLMRLEDEPGEVVGFSYVGCIFNTVNGQRISLQEIIDNFSNIFDITMFQILKELNKAKGKIVGYNRAALPKGKSMKEIIYDAVNDSFVDYSTAGASNQSGRDLDLKAMFEEVDLGLSNSFQHLISFKREILATLDRLTGINENREGQIAASSTATNAQSAIHASRTITEGLFFIMQMFTEQVLIKLCETTKLTWGLYKTEKAKIILGDEKYAFMQVTKDIAYCDWGIHLLDGGKELSIRQKLEAYGEASINAKELRFKDMVDFHLADTLAEGRQVLIKAWDEIQSVRQQELKMQNEANAKNVQAQIEGQRIIKQEEREDKQGHEHSKIDHQAEADIRVKNNETKGKMIADQNNIEQNNLFAGEQ